MNTKDIKQELTYLVKELQFMLEPSTKEALGFSYPQHLNTLLSYWYNTVNVRDVLNFLSEGEEIE